MKRIPKLYNVRRRQGDRSEEVLEVDGTRLAEPLYFEKWTLELRNPGFKLARETSQPVQVSTKDEEKTRETINENDMTARVSSFASYRPPDKNSREAKRQER